MDKLFGDKENYEEKKKKLIEKYPLLTEEDFEEEDDDKLIIHLQQKLGKHKDEIRTIIKDL